jgi:hypothetical protein
MANCRLRAAEPLKVAFMVAMATVEQEFPGDPDDGGKMPDQEAA